MGKKFSELERAVSLNNGDLAAFAQVDQSAPTGYKSKAAPMSLVSQKILKDTEYASDLQTDNKTVLGAINEVNSRTIVYDVASGPIANFNTSLEMPIKSLEIDVNAVQASGTPTPTTPLPISGWSEVKIVHTGKNLTNIAVLPYTFHWGTDAANLVQFLNTLPVGRYTISNKYKINEIPNSGKVSHGAFFIRALVNGSEVNVTPYSIVTDSNPFVGKVYQESVSFVITDAVKGKINHAYRYCDQDNSHTGSGRGSYDCYDVQIETGSAVTDFVPYDGNEYIINLGDTYYSGHFTQDKDGHRQFEVTHNYIASYNGETINEPWISSMDAYSQGATPTTGAQVVYPLATPSIIDLPDGEPIITLIGTNNIYADSGDASVEYALTIKDYIDKKIASVQALILNS